MPIQSCELNGKPGYKWGESGKCYTYTDEASMKDAKSKANAQGQAARASGYMERIEELARKLKI